MLGAAALLLAGSANLSCRVENAEYRLRRQPEVVAWFRPVDSGPDWPSHVALGIRFRDAARAGYPRSGKTYWWLPYDGGSDGRQNLASTLDVTSRAWRPPSPDGGPRPYGDMEVVFADQAYNIWDHVPQKGEAAPGHFLLPELRDLRHVGGGVVDATEKQFFDLVSCSRRGH